VANFYCKFFHFLLSFLIVALLGLAAWSLQLLFSFYFSGQGASRVI
jgi:hypothetical protein